MDVFTRVMYMHACTKDKKNLVDNWEAGHFKRVKREREMCGRCCSLQTSD